MSQAPATAPAKNTRARASLLAELVGKWEVGTVQETLTPESSQVVIPGDGIVLTGFSKSVLIELVCVLKVHLHLGRFGVSLNSRRKSIQLYVTSSTLNLP